MILLRLLETYAQHQKLVLEIITALHPDFIARADKSVSIMELLELAQKYHHVPQIGVWYTPEGSWDYFFHGGGCRLTHQQTGEPIDWDPPNTNVVDSYKFAYWLEWAIRTQPNTLDVNLEKLSFNDKNPLDDWLKISIQSLIDQDMIVLHTDNRLFIQPSNPTGS